MTPTNHRPCWGLERHPIEGGHFRRTYTCANTLYLPRGMRPMGTAIYYCSSPEPSPRCTSLASDEIFHFYLGDPVEMLQLYQDGSSATFVLGQDLMDDQHVQLVVPSGVCKARAW